MSDTTQMVTFPRELSDELAELIAKKAKVCGGGAFDIWEAICEQFGQESEAAGAGGCAYEIGDWQCREGGYLWYAGDGDGYDPEDCTHICPHCRTKDYLEAAKEEAESCSRYTNNGSSGTGLDIWTSSERTALEANRPEALKAMAELGPVSALDGDEAVICNTQQVKP